MSDDETVETSQTDDKKCSSKPKQSRMFKKKVKCIENINEITLEIFKRKSDNLSLETVHNVIRQLGYVPYNLVEVAAQATDSPTPNPLVLQLYPLNTNDLDGRYAKSVGQPLPFPTMMWMSCRLLYAQISVLEDAGWIQVFQKRLLNSPETPEWLQVMDSAHRQYAAERWSLLTPEDLELVEKNNWTAALKDVGIAGIRDFSAVKCLHCHYAHFLARPAHNNIIGQWIHEQLVALIASTASATIVPSELDAADVDHCC